MEKRTKLAIALSVVVMILFMFIQNTLYPPQVPPPAQETSGAAVSAPGQNDSPLSQAADGQQTASAEPGAARPSGTVEAAGAAVPPRKEVVNNGVIEVVLSNAGGTIESFKLLDAKEPENPEKMEEMILGESGNAQAFAVAFANRADTMSGAKKPETGNFRVRPRQASDLAVEFSQDFNVNGQSFTLVKRYQFMPGEYMFELGITITPSGANPARSFDFNGAAYTLVFGPQIGPGFEKLDQRYEYRNFLSFKEGKMRTEKVSEREAAIISDLPSWLAIAGKYFTLTAMPYFNYEAAFSTKNNPEPAVPSNESRLFITRPAGPTINDKYHFYLGPKNQETLNIYERGENGFNLRGTGLIELANTKGFLAPLENLLKWFLMLFHRITGNYGVAIILLTVLVKLAMFPLTKKSSASTMRMQSLAPRIKEIQEKNKGNPQRMNAEMAEFYKREGYNPLSGCLPMLIQLPIFFAMYNLFSNHFDLRGAEFIPVWIPDLSLPEAVYVFPDNFSLPVLGWTAIRLLPFIYVASQLLYGKATQTPDQKGTTQMKFMLYAMPIIFFFVLYNVPSGLLLYWIMSNILTMVQQMSINKFLAHKKAAMAAENGGPAPVIAPGGGRKKKKN